MQTVSISYLRCLIEHVRCYILDRDIELVYYTIRKSSDVLTRDPMQLGAQVRKIYISCRTLKKHKILKETTTKKSANSGLHCNFLCLTLAITAIKRYKKSISLVLRNNVKIYIHVKKYVYVAAFEATNNGEI